jgi:hypothetical protein
MGKVLKWPWEIKSPDDIVYNGDLERFVHHMNTKMKGWLPYREKPAEKSMVNAVRHLIISAHKRMLVDDALLFLLVSDDPKFLQAIARYSALTFALNYPLNGVTGRFELQDGMPYRAINGKYARIAEVTSQWLVEADEHIEDDAEVGARQWRAKMDSEIVIWQRMNEGHGTFRTKEGTLNNWFVRMVADGQMVLCTFVAESKRPESYIEEEIEKWYGATVSSLFRTDGIMVFFDRGTKLSKERVRV